MTIQKLITYIDHNIYTHIDLNIQTLSSNNLLDTTRLSTLYPQVKDIKTSVRDILYKIKKKI